MTKTIIATAFLISILIPATGYSASFDCQKAKTEVEKMICADARLSRLDDDLASSFRSALNKVQNKSGLRQGQKGWIAQRDNDCWKKSTKGTAKVDSDCLWFAYQVRTAQFKAIALENTSGPNRSEVARFPPYPDTWGYEFPYGAPGNPFSYIQLFEPEESGEMHVTFSVYRDPRREAVGRRGTLALFSGTRLQFSQKELNDWSLKHHDRLIQYGGQKKITYPDGREISAEDSTDSVCYENFARHLQLSDASGKVLARKSIVYLLDEAVNRQDRSGQTCDEGRGMEVWERARTDRLSVVPLEDGTFLAHSRDANYIIRFDKHLNTRYTNGKRVFVVDTDLIERIQAQVAEDQPYFQRAQEINDKINEFILNLIQ